MAGRVHRQLLMMMLATLFAGAVAGGDEEQDLRRWQELVRKLLQQARDIEQSRAASIRMARRAGRPSPVGDPTPEQMRCRHRCRQIKRGGNQFASWTTCKACGMRTSYQQRPRLPRPAPAATSSSTETTTDSASTSSSSDPMGSVVSQVTVAIAEMTAQMTGALSSAMQTSAQQQQQALLTLVQQQQQVLQLQQNQHQEVLSVMALIPGIGPTAQADAAPGTQWFTLEENANHGPMESSETEEQEKEEESGDI